MNLKIPATNNPTTTFIANHNTPFLTCLFAYHVIVPSCELRVASFLIGNNPFYNPYPETRNAKPGKCNFQEPTCNLL